MLLLLSAFMRSTPTKPDVFAVVGPYPAKICKHADAVASSSWCLAQRCRPGHCSLAQGAGHARCATLNNGIDQTLCICCRSQQQAQAEAHGDDGLHCAAAGLLRGLRYR
jgi:hypothetical protein